LRERITAPHPDEVIDAPAVVDEFQHRAVALDRAVDRLYRKKPFASITERLGLLYKRYRELTAGCPAGCRRCWADDAHAAAPIHHRPMCLAIAPHVRRRSSRGSARWAVPAGVG
jgi:hypothetical protein